MKYSRAFLLIIFLVLNLLGCSDDSGHLAGPDGKVYLRDTLIVELGSSFTICKEAALTAGYMWEIEKGFNEHYIELVRYTVEDTDPAMDGSPFLQEWEYLTRNPGKISCALKYGRPWEEDVEIVNYILVFIEESPSR